MYKRSKYEMIHELPNELRLRNLPNQEILGKCLNFIGLEPSAQPRCQKKQLLLVLARRFRKLPIKLFPWSALSHGN